MPRIIFAAALALNLAACSETDTSAPQTSVEQDSPKPEAVLEPPPLPEGQETVEFERTAPAETAPSENTGDDAPRYWGIAPGEPLPIMWDDLMPEGSAEELFRQQEEFYRMLELRYMANTTRLADAAANSIDSIEEGSELDYMPQFGTFDVVEDLNGELIRIPGYIVPFDFNPRKRHESFLFVPYMGACIHTPPPPPNQII
ncbi:MAG: DUF3299 domain-containing protein, partial [Pseudomonadota bacterium]